MAHEGATLLLQLGRRLFSQGLNGFGTSKWGSPCPPSGVHHYVFDLYALDNTLPLTSSQGRGDLENAMKGHMIAHAKLVGLYGK